MIRQQYLIQLCQDEDNVEYMVRLGALSIEDGMRISDILNTYDGVNAPQIEGSIEIAGQAYPLYIAWRWFMVGNSALGIPGGNVVINALGVHPETPAMQVSRIEIIAGDRLFLCSDGLYKNLTEGEIIAGLSQSGDAATRLGMAALARSQDKQNQRATADDIAVILVEIA